MKLIWKLPVFWNEKASYVKTQSNHRRFHAMWEEPSQRENPFNLKPIRELSACCPFGMIPTNIVILSKFSLHGNFKFVRTKNDKINDRLR